MKVRSGSELHSFQIATVPPKGDSTGDDSLTTPNTPSATRIFHTHLHWHRENNDRWRVRCTHTPEPSTTNAATIAHSVVAFVPLLANINARPSQVGFHKRYPLMASASDDGNVHVFHAMVYRSATRGGGEWLVCVELLADACACVHGVVAGRE